jgi:hypothetical protein
VAVQWNSEHLGPVAPNTLASRNNLALVLHYMGRLNEAEHEHRAELTICARVLGPEHPETLISRNNLACMLRDMGRLDEAEREFHTVGELRMSVLGPGHPDTLNSRDRLAQVRARRDGAGD